MARNAATMAVIVYIILVFTIASVITFSLANTISVGGLVYRDNSEACASCHNEVPYVAGYKDSPHYKGNVTCMDCHKYKSPNTDAQCLTCHQDYDKSNKTKFMWLSDRITIDAHSKTAHMPARCTTCHIQHQFYLGIPKEDTQSLCRGCHKPYVKK
ncbi:MAG: cytochrome c3 family protein [Thaumarchaeota archaeon]|nr:cytochrome c3 family protein [Nitrososphaerota archaeon]MCL5317107.1 cytochrome c3 family protein [Nitrososphaerota archaeon]